MLSVVYTVGKLNKTKNNSILLFQNITAKPTHRPRMTKSSSGDKTFAKIHLRSKKSHWVVYGLYGKHNEKFFVRNSTLVLIDDVVPKNKPKTHYGCSNHLANHKQLKHLKKKKVRFVGMVDRGHCTFMDKIRFGYDIGAVGLIIRYDTEEFRDMVTLGLFQLFISLQVYILIVFTVLR